MLKDTLIIVHKVKILITLLRTKEVLDLYVELQNSTQQRNLQYLSAVLFHYRHTSSLAVTSILLLRFH